jgi:hypothetical protein
VTALGVCDAGGSGDNVAAERGLRVGGGGGQQGRGNKLGIGPVAVCGRSL